MKKKQTQSFSGLIRERLPLIEQRLAVGVRQEVILAELAKEGYQTTLANLKNEIWRARSRAAKDRPARLGGWKKGTANSPEPTGNAKPASQGIGTPRAPKPHDNPLTKPTGFNYGGTKDISADDLV